MGDGVKAAPLLLVCLVEGYLALEGPHHTHVGLSKDIRSVCFLRDMAEMEPVGLPSPTALLAGRGEEFWLSLDQVRALNR